MPSSSSVQSSQENSSGVVRSGKGYIIDGEEVKGIMIRWKKYKTRIDNMERAAGFVLSRKGKRIPLRQMDRMRNKRNVDEAELPEEAASETESSESTYEEAPPEEIEEAKKKSPPKSKKRPKKRQRT